MGEVLSQDEIDNLLKALSTGELDADEMKNTDERQVKDYDFARPAKFSKEHLRTLEIIFEHFGRLLATNLPAYLRKSVSVDVVNSEVVIYSEFSNALSNPVLLGVVGMDPLMGNVIMEMASNLGFAIVDRLLGGVGNSLEKERDFSEIELSILERVFTICVNLLHEPWENVVEITPRLNRIETNSQFAQIISPSETIAIVTINLKIGDVEGLMNICLPYTTLEPVMDKLNTKYWFSTMKEKDSNSYEAAIENIIDNALIPMKAVLGTSKIYDMLNEKAKEVKNTVKDVNIAKHEVKKMQNDIAAEPVSSVQQAVPSQQEQTDNAAYTATVRDVAKERLSELVKQSNEKARISEEQGKSKNQAGKLKSIVSGEPEIDEIPENPQDGSPESIVYLYRKGMTVRDIAKQLGIGVGEVSLIIGLHEKEKQSAE